MSASSSRFWGFERMSLAVDFAWPVWLIGLYPSLEVSRSLPGRSCCCWTADDSPAHLAHSDRETARRSSSWCSHLLFKEKILPDPRQCYWCCESGHSSSFASDWCPGWNRYGAAAVEREFSTLCSSFSWLNSLWPRNLRRITASPSPNLHTAAWLFSSVKQYSAIYSLPHHRNPRHQGPRPSLSVPGLAGSERS